MDEPIVRSYNTFRCPRCNRIFFSRERYDAHSCDYSDELVTKAESMIGEWVVVAGSEAIVAGIVRGSDGPKVIIEGYVLNERERSMHISWYERFSVHVSKIRDASGPHNAMMIFESLMRAGFRDRFLDRFPEARGDEE